MGTVGGHPLVAACLGHGRDALDGFRSWPDFDHGADDGGGCGHCTIPDRATVVDLQPGDATRSNRTDALAGTGAGVVVLRLQHGGTDRDGAAAKHHCGNRPGVFCYRRRRVRSGPAAPGPHALLLPALMSSAVRSRVSRHSGARIRAFSRRRHRVQPTLLPLRAQLSRCTERGEQRCRNSGRRRMGLTARHVAAVLLPGQIF